MCVFSFCVSAYGRSVAVGVVAVAVTVFAVVDSCCGYSRDNSDNSVDSRNSADSAVVVVVVGVVVVAVMTVCCCIVAYTVAVVVFSADSVC